MKNNRTRLAALLLSAVMVAGMYTGCSKQAADGDVAKPVVPTEMEKRDSIIVATSSETPSMNPFAHNSTAGNYMNVLTFDTLFITDENMNPIPSLVETWENVSDTELVVKIKEGIKFHDDTVMTAEDVVASLNYAKTFMEVSQYTAAVSTAEVIDNLTVKITTFAPSASLLYDLSNHASCIVPKALIDSGNDFNKNPIGSGPYALKSRVLGDSLTFEAFADYFKGKPAIQNMTWRIIPEGSSRTIALEAGEVDVIIEVESMDAQRIEENKDLTLVRQPASQVTWLMINNEKPGLDNENVRHAINSAINKENVVTVALNGNGRVAVEQTPANLVGASAENADAFDVAKAKKYLAASGVNPADISFSIICSNDTKKRAAEVIQSNMLDIGINCQIESMDLATYLSSTLEGNYTAAIGGYSATDMPTVLSGVFHSKMINAANQARINNPELDAMIEKVAATVDADAREVLAKEVNALLNKLCPLVPLYQDMHIRAFNSKLQDVAFNAAGTIHFENVSWGE